MHPVVEAGLENYLSGISDREIDSHLAACPDCRLEVERAREIGRLLHRLRAERELPVSLGFSARVLRGVRSAKGQSLWNILTVETAFARKLALASLLGLAALGGYLATLPDSPALSQRTPESAIAGHDVSAPDMQQHRDRMLVTLATYRQ